MLETGFSPVLQDGPATGMPRLFPHFLFRSTGFSLDLIEGLACPRSLEQAERVLAQERTLEDLTGCLLEVVRDRVRRGLIGPSLSAASRKVRHRRPVSAEVLAGMGREGDGAEAVQVSEYNALLAGVGAAKTTGEAMLREEMGEARVNLLQAAAEPRFQEAVLLSSPGALAGIERLLAGGKTRRQAEAKTLLYLQRLCAKNDTISFFGPISWGLFDPASPAGCELSWQGEGLSGRHVFFEHWMADRLATAMEADPELAAILPWRISYPFEWDETAGSLYRDYPMSGRSRRAVSPAAAALLAALGELDVMDEGVPAQALLARVCRPAAFSPAEAGQAFDQLRHDRVVRALVVKVESLHPVENLLAALLAAVSEEDPGRRRWEMRLRELLALRDEFEPAPLAERRRLFGELETRFSAWTASEARRNGGRTYGGRNLLYEECTRHPERFVLGGQLHEDLEADLGSLVEVQSALMEVVAPYGWQRLKEIHEALAASGGPVPLSKFLLKLSRMIGSGYLDVSLVRPEDVERLLDQADAVLDLSRNAGGIAVQARDGGAVQRVGLLRRPVVMGADVMIAAAGAEALERGEYRFILGEIQYFPLGYPEYLWVFHPDRERFYDDYQRLIVAPRANGGRLARLELEAEVTRLIRIERPLADYVMVDNRGRPYDSRRPQREVTGLTVELGDGEILIRDKNGEQLVLGNPHHDLFLDACWKLLLRLYQRHCAMQVSAGLPTPELTVGRRMVLVRRTWQLDPGLLSAAPANGHDPWRELPFDTFLALQRLRRDNGWPRYLFARVPGEVKPVLVDFASPLLLANLTRMAAPGKAISLTEMRPAPGELWLTGAVGRHTSEMRIFLA